MVSPLFTPPDIKSTLEKIASALYSTGYIILERTLPQTLLNDLFLHFKSLDEEKFKRAGIGKETDFQVNPFIRTDEIHWLEGSHPVTRDYIHWTEQIRKGLNKRLFLGLFDYECHYAFYSEGAFYKKHLDAFSGSNTRKVSTVLYLNPRWSNGDGGELLIYSPDSGEVLEKVEPLFGRAVIFLSEEFPHEVLPVQVPRYSLSGWYRVNSSLAESIDPPR